MTQREDKLKQEQEAKRILEQSLANQKEVVSLLQTELEETKIFKEENEKKKKLIQQFTDEIKALKEENEKRTKQLSE